ncbi:hypothetical protein BGX38DRAFT_1162004 [Terfezia claveryi]|nr:hypothetical protein BGX38DRAFT_1162004 [Terfezia claveryi]
MITITNKHQIYDLGRQLREESNPAIWSSTPELDEVLQVLEDSYSMIRETVISLGRREHCWLELECLTEGLASEPFKKIIILSNALRDIVITLIQGFPLPAFNKGLGVNSEENDIRVNKITRLLQAQGPQTTEHRNPNYKHNDAPRHGDHAFTLHNPSMNSRQPGELKADTSPEEIPLLEDAATRSQNCLAAFASDIGESASACGVYDTTAQVTRLGSVSRNLIGESHDTSQQHPNPEPTADSAIKWTAINSKGPMTHRWVTKGVPCPIKTCPRNGRSPPKYFARADNLGGHLRKVHGIHIPSRARVRHWITGNKSQVLLQAAENRTRELRELGILGPDGTWEPLES